MALHPQRCAVLIAGSGADDTDASPLGHESPLHLTPLLGKCALLYAVEALVACGMERIICLGWDEPVRCQTQLGNGERWGCQIEWHSLSGPEQAFARLPDLAPEEGPYLLASTACLMMPERLTELPAATAFVPLGPVPQDQPDGARMHWAWLDRAQSETLARDGSWRDWDTSVATVCVRQQAVACLDLKDGAALLSAIPIMLTQQFPVVIDGSEIEPGIFVSRNVVIHPTAQITAPVYMGADVLIAGQCRIGPGVALGCRSHVGRGSELVHTQLGPDSWLGASLDVQSAVVWRGVIWSAQHQARLPVVDAGLLMHGAAWRWRRELTRQMCRAVAAVLLLLLWPLAAGIALAHHLGLSGSTQLWLVKARRAPRATTTSRYTAWLGAGPQTRGWRHALGFVLPNLGAVVQGRLSLVGLRPRTAEEWEAIAPDHRNWLAGRACGLIQEEGLVENATEDVLQSMVLERFQDMRSNDVVYPWRLLARYVLQLLRTAQPSPHKNAKGKPVWN